MKRLVLLISMPAFFLVLSAIVFAQVADVEPAATRAENNPIVNIEMTDVAVEDAINSLFANTDINYILRPGITGTISRLRLLDIRLDQAVKSIADAAKLEYSINEEGTYLIGPTEQTAVVVGTQQPTQQDQNIQQPDANQNLQYEHIMAPEFYTDGSMIYPYGWYDPSMQYYYEPGYYVPYFYEESLPMSRMNQRIRELGSSNRLDRFRDYGTELQFSPRTRLIDPYNQPYIYRW